MKIGSQHNLGDCGEEVEQCFGLVGSKIIAPFNVNADGIKIKHRIILNILAKYFSSCTGHNLHASQYFFTSCKAHLSKKKKQKKKSFQRH